MKAVVPILDVESIPETEEVLKSIGFETYHSGGDPVDYACLRLGGLEIHLRSKALSRQPGIQSVRLLVEDVQECAAACKQNGAKFVQGDTAVDDATIVETPWGTKEFYLYEPTGHSIIIYQNI